MNYRKRLLQLAIATGALAALAFIAVNLWSYSAYSQIDSMSRELNPAEKPEKAFQALNERMQKENHSRPWERFEDSPGPEGLVSRLTLSGKGLYDVAIVGGVIFEPMQRNQTLTNRSGAFTAHCKFRYLVGEMCSYRKNVPTFTHMTAGWFLLGQAIGGLDALWNNETATRQLSLYLERAEYYDARLRKGGFQMKPIQMAFYTDTGLYLAGDWNGNITIDNTTVDPQQKGKLMYTDTELELGEHTIRAGDQEIELKVTYRIPDKGFTDEQTLAVEEHTRYTRVILKGPEGTNTAEIRDNDTVTLKVPSKKRLEEGEPDSYAEPEPFNVTLISPEVNVTYTYGRPDTGWAENANALYSFGMTPEEYERMGQIFKTMKKIPFTEQPAV